MRGFQLSYSFCAVGLEAVVDTEYEVVAVEVETETVVAVSAVLVVSIAVAEEAAVSHEVYVLGKVHANTGLNASLPASLRVGTLDLVALNTCSDVSEEANGTELGESVASVGVYFESVSLDTLVVSVAIAKLDTEVPVSIEVVANFGSDGEIRRVSVSVTPETYTTTYVNLSGSSYTHEGNEQRKYKLFHAF